MEYRGIFSFSLFIKLRNLFGKLLLQELLANVSANILAFFYISIIDFTVFKNLMCPM